MDLPILLSSTVANQVVVQVAEEERVTTNLTPLEALLTTGTTAPLTREESDQVRDLANMPGMPMGGAYLIPLVEEVKRLEEEKEEEKEKEEKEDKEEEEEREKEEDTEQEEDAEREEEREKEEDT